jgi:predicted esterase
MRYLLYYTVTYAIPSVFVLVSHSVAAFLFPVLGESLSSSNRHHSYVTTCMSSKGTSETPRVVRVLALHGSEGNGPEFVQRLEPLVQSLSKQNVDLQLTAITAPFEKGIGFAWWSMPPGMRSFTAKEFQGFETSASLVLDAMEEQGPFHAVLGHSQGAILISALLALGRISTHPPMGYILNGVAVPNPYRKELESLRIKETVAPRVLFILGENDKINPIEIGDDVKASMIQAGLATSTCYHPGGHSVPVNDEKALQQISKWVIDGNTNE